MVGIPLLRGGMRKEKIKKKIKKIFLKRPRIARMTRINIDSEKDGKKQKQRKPRRDGCDYRRWCYDRMLLLVCEHPDKIIP